MRPWKMQTMNTYSYLWFAVVGYSGLRDSVDALLPIHWCVQRDWSPEWPAFCRYSYWHHCGPAGRLAGCWVWSTVRLLESHLRLIAVSRTPVAGSVDANVGDVCSCVRRRSTLARCERRLRRRSLRVSIALSDRILISVLACPRSEKRYQWSHWYVVLQHVLCTNRDIWILVLPVGR